MTHDDILIKFKIEYDKADVASSYPSLTQYEIATVLNKAYLALIAQKVTGNNQRKVPFEYDTKAIEDLRPLVTRDDVIPHGGDNLASNEQVFELPGDMLYMLNAKYGTSNVMLVPHEIANKYKVTDINYPWVKQPVCYLEGDLVYLLRDPKRSTKTSLCIFYIKKPKKFNLFKNSDLFELSDTMAEELINLAILMALETVESSRLNSKSSMLSLES